MRTRETAVSLARRRLGKGGWSGALNSGLLDFQLAGEAPALQFWR